MAMFSGALTKDGKLALRLIYAHDQRDSYLRYNHVNRNVYGALVSYEFTPRLTLNAGYTRQENNSAACCGDRCRRCRHQWYAGQLSAPASTSAPWTYWNITDQTAFAELEWKGQNGWQARGRYTYNHRESNAKLLYGFGYADATTGLGNAAWPGIYRSPYDQNLFDGQASGPVKLFGREHQLSIGVSHATMHGREYSQSTLSYPSYASVTDWAVNGIYPARLLCLEVLSEDSRDKLTRIYGAIHANITDRLKGVFGASAMWLRPRG
jgi:outer membrane receptor for ferric coprogen and ferric-rhodotorulic acid